MDRVRWLLFDPQFCLVSQVSSRYTHLMAACGQINQIPKSSLTGSMMHCSIQHCCWAQFSRVLKNTQVAMYCFSSCFWMNSATIIIHWQIICKSFYWCCSIKSWMETVPLKTPSFGWSKNSQSESKPMSVMSEKEKLKQRGIFNGAGSSQLCQRSIQEGAFMYGMACFGNGTMYCLICVFPVTPSIPLNYSGKGPHLKHILIYAIYLCIYVCMHACMHVCMHACMHACMYMYIYVCVWHVCVSMILSSITVTLWAV